MSRLNGTAIILDLKPSESERRRFDQAGSSSMRYLTARVRSGYLNEMLLRQAHKV